MHPWEIHPALVHFPIALLIVGTILDAGGTWRGRSDVARVGQWSLALGLLTGLVAGAFGLLAYWTIPRLDDRYRSYLNWHLGVNLAALALFAFPVMNRRGERWRDRSRGALLAEALGCVLLLAAGALGHAAVVRGGAGVDPDILGPRATPTAQVRETS